MGKRSTIISIAITLLIISGIVAGATANLSTKTIDKDLAIKFGEIIKEYNDSSDSKVVAKVNGIEIYEKEILKRRNIGKLSSDNKKSNKELILDAAKTQLLLLEAKRRSIAVSEDKAIAYAQKEKEMIYENPETKEALLAYINSLGLTEDEYWNNYTIKEVQKMLTIAELNEQIANEELKDIQISEVGKKSKKQEIVDRFKEQIIKNARIEILDEKYK